MIRALDGLILEAEKTTAFLPTSRIVRVSYVEAHGTGIALGDPVEFGALKTAYGARRCVRRLCTQFRCAKVHSLKGLVNVFLETCERVYISRLCVTDKRYHH